MYENGILGKMTVLCQPAGMIQIISKCAVIAHKNIRFALYCLLYDGQSDGKHGSFP